MRPVIIAAGAGVDIGEAALWYQLQRDGLGDEFLAEISSKIGVLCKVPDQFRRVRRRPEVRRALTKRFPYRIYFVVRSNAIVVIRVLHAARHDREWRRAVGDLPA